LLAVNFHKTFIPERRLLTAFLDYVALGKEGTLQEIAAETGIPMGKYTGKLPAIIDYSIGMGLTTVSQATKVRQKKTTLTPFGETIVLNDRFLGEPLSQWIAHINLCRNDIGARVWNSVFMLGRNNLGVRFTLEQLENYLQNIYGGKSRTGPLVSTYFDDAALSRTGALKISPHEKIQRGMAPVIEAWADAYCCIILDLMETRFPGQAQVTLTDFAQKTGLFDITLWRLPEIDSLFSILEGRGHITLDRLMTPWIIEKNGESRHLWVNIFDSLA
jgi:hypothetical protein